MGNLFYGLHINKSALRVQTDVLNNAAHNIANANTTIAGALTKKKTAASGIE